MNYKRTKLACFYTYVSMSSIFCIPAMLFMTFHNTFNISYTLLGTLVLINFCVQLFIDLIFTFFSKKFNIKLTVTLMPLITSLGLILYAILPMLFKDYAYIGLVIGTIIFSVSAGLSEVLLSPIVSSIPSKNKEKDMSTLHSLYAWGVLLMVIIATLFINIFGQEKWMYLILLLSLFPIPASILFKTSSIPDMSFESNTKNSNISNKIGLMLCVMCIFFGSCSENVMTNWISTYMEKTLSISKRYCDIIGIALFALLLGATRTLYAKYGKKIINVLLCGFVGAAVCYITVAIANNNYIAAIFCVLTGVFTAMLWPGSLIMMEENMPLLGVSAYALMAAGGDFGASFAPQLMGIITDNISKTQVVENIALNLNLSVEQVGLKVGMLFTSIFPILGIIVILIIKKYFYSKKSKNLKNNIE